MSPNLDPYVTDFQIKRRPAAGGPYEVIDTVDRDERSYEDTSMEQGVNYCYVVSAHFAKSCPNTLLDPESAPSNEICLSTCDEPPCEEPTISGWLFTDQGIIGPDESLSGDFRAYNDPSEVAASPWSFSYSSGTLTLRMDYEDDENCEQHNPNVQKATAESVIAIASNCEVRLTADWIGMVEQRNTGYERMWLYLDGIQIAYGESTQGQDQDDCPPMLPVSGDQEVVLQPGFHVLRVETDTGIDGRYHHNAYYEFNMTLASE